MSDLRSPWMIETARLALAQDGFVARLDALAERVARLETLAGTKDIVVPDPTEDEALVSATLEVLLTTCQKPFDLQARAVLAELRRLGRLR